MSLNMSSEGRLDCRESALPDWPEIPHIPLMQFLKAWDFSGSMAAASKLKHLRAINCLRGQQQRAYITLDFEKTQTLSYAHVSPPKLTKRSHSDSAFTIVSLKG